MLLDGKLAVITGAGAGIGRALAIEAAARGVCIALFGRRLGPLQETLSKLLGTGHFLIEGDVTSPADRAALMAAIDHRWGRLDILVNNAGIVSAGRLRGVTDDELRLTIETNLLAPIALVRQALPLLQRAKRARIVNIGSLLGDIPYPLFTVYSATKSGLHGFSIALRRELAPMEIGVTYAAPRATRTASSHVLGALIEPFRMKLDAPEAVARFHLERRCTGDGQHLSAGAGAHIRSAAAAPSPARGSIHCQAARQGQPRQLTIG